MAQHFHHLSTALRASVRLRLHSLRVQKRATAVATIRFNKMKPLKSETRPGTQRETRDFSISQSETKTFSAHEMERRLRFEINITHGVNFRDIRESEAEEEQRQRQKRK